MNAHNHNPDILSCLANLSNDEVFTPPHIARQMLDLLPASLWRNPEARFLDPCTKSGVFLREIATRLIEGLKDWQPDLQKRIDHILGKQLYGIAITELTALISRRTLYCCKTANSELSIATIFDDSDGNIRFNREAQHEWTKEHKCKYCSANKEKYDRGSEAENHAYEFIHTDQPEKIWNNMKFDVIIGNPPYQMEDGGGTGSSARPLYHLFVQQAKKLNPHYLIMITPSRWFSGGKGLDDFRDEMLNTKDNQGSIKTIVDYIDSNDCFPGVDISGGVSYFLWETGYREDCLVRTIESGEMVSSMKRPLKEEGADVFIRFNEAISILRKIKQENEESFSSFVYSRKPFGLPSSFIGKKKKRDSDVLVHTSKGETYIDKSEINQNFELIFKYKVYIAKAYGERISSNFWVLGKPFLGEPNTACSETYLAIGAFDSESTCQNVMSYIRTQFFRFLVLLKKNTQNSSKSTYQFVPIQDFSRPWTDADLYAKYGLTADEIAFIEKMVRPMD